MSARLHPDALDGVRLVGRTQGDALQLAGLVRDHGAETLGRILDAWGPDHLRRVVIALAAAVDIDQTPRELWGWLDGPNLNGRLSTTVPLADLFNRLDPGAEDLPRRPAVRNYSDADRQAMGDRARAAALSRRGRTRPIVHGDAGQPHRCDRKDCREADRIWRRHRPAGVPAKDPYARTG